MKQALKIRYKVLRSIDNEENWHFIVVFLMVKVLYYTKVRGLNYEVKNAVKSQGLGKIKVLVVYLYTHFIKNKFTYKHNEWYSNSNDKNNKCLNKVKDSFDKYQQKKQYIYLNKNKAIQVSLILLPTQMDQMLWCK